MGYTTDFKGNFSFNKPLTANQVKYLQAFCDTRRMKRDAAKTELLPDELRKAVGLPVGDDGGYYVGSHDGSVIDYNTPPGQIPFQSGGSFDDIWQENNQKILEGKCQPGLWCQWTVSDDGNALEWDGGEKFYYYIEWLKYLINNFFNIWGVELTGSVEWYGEDEKDKGEINVKSNEISIVNR